MHGFSIADQVINRICSVSQVAVHQTSTREGLSKAAVEELQVLLHPVEYSLSLLIHGLCATAQ